VTLTDIHIDHPIEVAEPTMIVIDKTLRGAVACKKVECDAMVSGVQVIAGKCYVRLWGGYKRELLEMLKKLEPERF